ncbi:MAG: NAD(P)-dependent oxidoreductase [Gammaproteobacteria bacterium]
MNSVIAITGATGFIGKAISIGLLAAGYEVRALVRQPACASDLQQVGIQLVPGSLSDNDSLRSLVDGVDAVVHCAGVVRGVSQEDFDRVNVSGTENLFSVISEQKNKPKVLVFSSLAAREPQLSFYARSKASMESWIQQNAKAINWQILRPPAVYGAGDKELLPVFKMMAKGVALVPGNAHAQFSMVHVDDVVLLVSKWLQMEEGFQEICSIDDSHGGYDWHEVAAIVSSLCQCKVKTICVSPWLLNNIAALNKLAGRLIGYSPMLTPEKVHELRHEDWVCDNDKLIECLHWQPTIRLAEGLARTPGWH